MVYIDLLREVQQITRMTQQDIAHELGITTVALNRWMNKKSTPRQSMISRINELHTRITSDNPTKQNTEPAIIFRSIKDDELRILGQKPYSEETLHVVAKHISNSQYTSEYIYSLLCQIPYHNRDFDWNVGSILQHCESSLVLDAFRRLKSPYSFQNSIGLAWLFGELGARDPDIIEFLRGVVNYSTDSDAWWRAAFSLEKLGAGDAVTLMKMSLRMGGVYDLDHHLNDLGNKKSIVAILILSNVQNVESIIYPRVKHVLLSTKSTPTLINCCWLVGRLGLMDDDILAKLEDFIAHHNYELKYYTFFALQNNTSESLRPLLERTLLDADPLIRKMACRALKHTGNEASIPVIESALYKETVESVVSELSSAIYALRNPTDKMLHDIERRASRNENGMIIDESDKWYTDASTYNVFSEAEDPHNICFDIVREYIKDMEIRNPIDIATGTGRTLHQIIEKIPYTGTLYGLDISEDMCEFLARRIKRDRSYTKPIEIINSPMEDLPKKHIKSSFIVSSFGFPSKISDVGQCIRELRSVYDSLDDNGVFITIGWDETFNDELSEMWFKHIPDKIRALNFEEWRRKRIANILSPRNCHLTWLKRGILVPLQFGSLQESIKVMGHLFGRDAAHEIAKSGRTQWNMSMGITMNTKASLERILQAHEKRS